MSSVRLGSLLFRVIDPRPFSFLEHWEILHKIVKKKSGNFRNPLAVATMTNQLKETQ